MKEKTVFILLTDTGTLFTKLIKLYTRKPYNHASFSFDSELSEVYSFGRKNARNPLIGGFIKEDVKEGLFKQANCVIYSLTVTDDQYRKIKCYINRIKEHKEDYRYNLLGLFGFLLNRPIKRKHAYFCSQFVASVLKEGNIIQFEKPLSLIAPSDFQEQPSFQLIYEGKLRSYLDYGEEKVHISELLVSMKI